MLATMNSSQRDVPIRERSHFDSHQDSHGNLSENGGLEDRLCPGCKKSAVSEHGGLVVAFGQSFFHVDCFKCAKCGDQVTADTNLLLLSDGSPICANCSYSCNVCHLPILDEAIMTGDDSYHAHCFKCKVCKSRIDELVFAKTTKGIYCMNCHNERMINLRKYTQRKAERERAGGSGSTKSREREARNFHRENELSSPPMDNRSRSHGLQTSNNSRPSSSRGADVSASVRPPAKSHSGPYVSDAFGSNPPTPGFITTSQSNSGKPLPSLHSFPSSQSISVTVAAPSDIGDFQESELLPPRFDQALELDRPNPLKQNTLPIPHGSVEVDPDGRRRSYDDGVRPLNVLFGRKGDPQGEVSSITADSTEGLNVNTSRRDKRRSINPALSLSNFNPRSGSSTSPISPRSMSLHHQPDDYISTSPNPAGRESPHILSPLRDQFPERSSSSRPTSHGSTHLSHSSVQSSRVSTCLSDNQTPDISRSSSRSSFTDEPSQDQTIVVNRSSLSTVTLEPVPVDKQRVKNGHDNQTAPANVNRSSASLSPQDARPSSRPDSANFGQNLLSRSRPTSPAYRADVPQNVESETDTEVEGDSSLRTQVRESVPPIPPPKDREKDILPRSKEPTFMAGETDPDVSVLLNPDSGSDDMSESSPVERMQHSTFIAPALPPIRFSMPADFSGLFSVEGAPSVKPLDHLMKVSEGELLATPTPPSTAVLENNLTPTNFTPPESTYDDKSKTYDLDSLINDDDQNISETNFPKSSHQRISLQSSNSESDNGTLIQSNESAATLHENTNLTRITLTEPGATSATVLRHDTTDIVTSRLHEVIANARERGAQQVKLDMSFIEAILNSLETRKTENQQLKSKFDGIKRTSKQYIDGLTVAQTEYDRELKARRDAEAEVTRLRVLLSGQVARLTVLSSDSRREELRQQLSRELNDNLSGLEHDLSRLRVERDMTLAEVEELSATRVTPELPSTNLGRSLTKRLETIKTQYKHDLVPLKQERETLTREVAELKAVRDVFLEETTVLNARNEELAQLSAVYFRRMEGHPGNSNHVDTLRNSLDKAGAQVHQVQQQSIPPPPSLSASTSGSSTAHEDTIDPGRMAIPKQNLEQHTPSKFRKWASKPKGVLSPPAASDRKAQEHNFQQLSVLRFTRCDHCGDKMWGSQLRCTVCNTSIHVRCVGHVQTQCAQYTQGPTVRPDSPPIPLPPSMFGRDLIEQVYADSKEEERQVPVIVEKCIDAVETLALDYEGIYRKTGGSGQSKAITQLFERGDYASFDLRDDDRFNDICSVTSVLKNYFRSLPIPLLTYDLHDQFMSAVHIRDPAIRHSSLLDLVNKLPTQHYHTLRVLMLHLHRIRERSERNLMNARNLGVVFGPTLMRSQDPSAEFSDMAGKALSIEWLVDNAPLIFNQDPTN